MNGIRFWILFWCLAKGVSGIGQAVYHPINKPGVYSFLDEMTTLGYTDIHTVVKPFTRQFIAEQLHLIDSLHQTELTSVQAGELAFYLRDFNKELIGDKNNFDKRFDALYRHDSSWSFTLNPIVGLSLYNDPLLYDRWVGVDGFASLGKHWGVYANFREHYQNAILTAPAFLLPGEGGAVRANAKSNEYSEMRGGFLYNWSWGHVGVVQDQMQWGNGYTQSNILSGRGPTFPMLTLQMQPAKWFSFRYLHGWLSSSVIDSTRSYLTPNGPRTVLEGKYLAANIFTFTPVKRLDVSLGNSVIYSDQAPHPAYLIPFFFWRPTDHSLSGSTGGNEAGSNGQLFFDISSRNIKGLHLYSTLFIDELITSGIFSKARNRNQVSFKLGAKTVNLLHRNISLTAEYTRNNPRVYRHIYFSTTYETWDYNLGHYLGENADDLYLSAQWRPLPRLQLEPYLRRAEKGATYDFANGNGGAGFPFKETTEFSRSEYGLQARYELFNDMFLNLQAAKTNTVDNTGKQFPAEWLGDRFFIHLSGGWNF